MGDQLQTLNQVKATAIDLAMRFGPKLVEARMLPAAA